MDMNQIVNVSIGLSVTPASKLSFSIPLLLVDHADVPVYDRYRTVTKTSYASALTAATDQLNWCAALWGQNYNPTQAYIGRWINAVTASHAIFRSATSNAATYAALTNTGKFKITEYGDAGITVTPNFTGVTTMAGVCAAIQAAFPTGVYHAYTCALDKLSRPVITSDNTGSTAASVTIAAPSSGVDLTGVLYLGAGTSVAGNDAESLGAALIAILAKGVSPAPFIICQRGGSIAQVTAFSTVINAMEKALILINNDANAETSATSDFCYAIHALEHDRTYMIYTEHTTQYPDASAIGEILSRPNKEGAVSLALNPMSGLSESGLSGTAVVPLTDDERIYLKGKGCDYLINPVGQTHMQHGLAASGVEFRIIIGKSFMAAKIAEDVYAYLLANEVVTFSDADVQAIKSIVSYWANEMSERKMLDKDTFVWNFPSAADFTAAMKATHTMTLSDVFSSDVLSAVNDIIMTLAFSI